MTAPLTIADGLVRAITGTDEDAFPHNRDKAGFARQEGAGLIAIPVADTPVLINFATTLTSSRQWTQENDAELLFMANGNRLIFVFLDLLLQKMLGLDLVYQFDLLLNGSIVDSHLVPLNDQRKHRQSFTSPIVVTPVPNPSVFTYQVTCVGSSTDIDILDYKLTSVDLLAA